MTAANPCGMICRHCKRKVRTLNNRNCTKSPTGKHAPLTPQEIKEREGRDA
jgi:L-lysine 2,3-aminomutase